MRKAVSLFTGAGGMDLGMEAAGFETAAAVEFDADAVKTLRANRDWPIFNKDIHKVSSDDLMDAGNFGESEIALLHGGPPCQPFSKSGYWAGGDAKRLEDPRATTLEAYLRVLRDLKPEVFLIENVAGLAYQNKAEGLHLLRDTIASINKEHGTNYSFHYKLLNAADYGVPQERERLFIVGHRDGKPFTFPEPTHRRADRGSGHSPSTWSTQNNLNLKGLPLATSCWDAIGDLEDEEHSSDLNLSGKWADLLPSIPEGCNYLYHTPRGDGEPLFGWRTRYWSFLLKLSKDHPSWTVTAKPGSAIGPFHWKNRWLSARELCRLQTFPDNYNIIGNRRAAQKQLGNAVPSALAEILGLEIRSQLLGDQIEDRTPSLIPERNTAEAKPEPVSDVPEKYLHLKDEKRKAHPGTGKGPGALAEANA